MKTEVQCLQKREVLAYVVENIIYLLKIFYTRLHSMSIASELSQFGVAVVLSLPAKNTSQDDSPNFRSDFVPALLCTLKPLKKLKIPPKPSFFQP